MAKKNIPKKHLYQKCGPEHAANGYEKCYNRKTGQFYMKKVSSSEGSSRSSNKKVSEKRLHQKCGPEHAVDGYEKCYNPKTGNYYMKKVGSSSEERSSSYEANSRSYSKSPSSPHPSYGSVSSTSNSKSVARNASQKSARMLAAGKSKPAQSSKGNASAGKQKLISASRRSELWNSIWGGIKAGLCFIVVSLYAIFGLQSLGLWYFGFEPAAACVVVVIVFIAFGVMLGLIEDSRRSRKRKRDTKESSKPKREVIF